MQKSLYLSNYTDNGLYVCSQTRRRCRWREFIFVESKTIWFLDLCSNERVPFELKPFSEYRFRFEGEKKLHRLDRLYKITKGRAEVMCLESSWR